MREVETPGHAQRFFTAYGSVASHFRPRGHRLSAHPYGGPAIDLILVAPTLTDPARLLPRVPTMTIDREGWVESGRDLFPSDEFEIDIGSDLSRAIKHLWGVRAIADDQQSGLKGEAQGRDLWTGRGLAPGNHMCISRHEGVARADHLLRPHPDTSFGISHGAAQIISYNAVLAGDGADLSGGRGCRHDAKAHPHIEDLIHLRIADAAARLNQAKDRLRLR
jgi:hypothetical protein